ncbi:MAG TPA: rhomboid family intramembrane serine protease [Chitinophagales bacterium]|nr:rhomboid family intramembrane serine protease [Chitinophagales bacterium]HMU69761.1 rhomboid family intramembrane serine protease [Chitinophagales bacterium]HNE44726.1 rhomboid family intramembrane serine protease [Chitinophagales bacterium]HNF69064.1 rhomboid family intramembrane serine protease [Chitinophagales bacterium]HNI53305.1 rhomboid family intramembrane serine protease [Chitinophagales bacterium]
MENVTVTAFIILLTAISSILAFNNSVMRGSALFYPHAMHQRGEWYRFITSGFIHADYIHLIVNMFVLWSFGSILEERLLPLVFQGYGRIVYVGIYLLGMIVSDVPSYFKHRTDATYRGLGASGAVAAVVFASILISPFDGEIGFFLIPGLHVKPFVFGIIYLIYSAYMGRRGGDNVNHDAHFYGALFGLIFPGLIKPELFISLYHQILQQWT